jgi:biotin synthase
MKPEEIVAAAKAAYDKGFRTVVLQSGEDSFYTNEDYIFIIKQIKAFGDIAVTLAFGEKSEAEYRAYFEAGADRYLLKHETSDRELYHALNPGMSYENRIRCLKILKKIGFQVGSGIMIGLPGQSLESIADDILLFLELDLDMMGCGPFIPHPVTPLADARLGSVDLTYRVLALNRIVSCNAHLPVTTALLTLDEGARELGLKRGANVIMPNLTPEKYRRLYDIYPAARGAKKTNFSGEKG